MKQLKFVSFFFFIFFNIISSSTTNANIPNEKPRTREAISIQSDSAEMNHTQGTAIHQGNVILKQGNKELIADKLIIHRNAQGKLDKIMAYGKPAKFTGSVNEQICLGEASSIIFYPASQDIILEGNAHLSKKEDTFSAPIISYNFDNKVVRSSAQFGQRPTITLNPN